MSAHLDALKVRKGYWFAQKLYGYGAVPVTWQGWLTTLAYVALVALLAWLMIQGIELGEVHLRFGIALAPEVHEALGEARDTWVKELADFFDRVNAEDRVVVEGINRGAQAPLATRGPLSWLEREIHDFARYLSARLNGPAKEKRKAR